MTSSVLAEIQQFLTAAQAPALVEPGAGLMVLVRGMYTLEDNGGRVVLQAWDESRTLTRRVRAVAKRNRGRLDLEIERFGKQVGLLFLVDQARPSARSQDRLADRMVLREQLRRALTRQFSGWHVAQLTTEMDLEHSLSPVYPRALLTQGGRGWAAVVCGPDATASDGLLAAGLIWLDYLRNRERRITVEGLALLCPGGTERNTCLRIHWLHPRAAKFAVFTYDESGEYAVDLTQQQGNLETRVEPVGPRAIARADPTLPEAILEKLVRQQIAEIDADLLPEPVYGQVPALAGIDRGLMDLLAVDRSGRLAVLELKATADLNLPIQAIDYWMRVRWHQLQGDFARMGYFPASALVAAPPRLLLVAPALEFHPTTETLLRYFTSAIEVERIGVGVKSEWSGNIQVAFRLRGSRQPY